MAYSERGVGLQLYYAHTLDGHPEVDWEPLLRHLQEVACNARVNGDRCGLGGLAEIAGLVHDLGKYSAGFQARLRGGAKVDHSTAGAVWAMQHLQPGWARLLAHVVAGHHAGLQDGLFDPEGRIEGKAATLAAVEQAAQADGLTLPTRLDEPAGLTFLRRQEGFHRAFLTRMVFSCLIDADRTAARRFEHGAPAEAPQPTIAALEAALQAGMARRATRPSPVNDLRNDVLRTALARAADPQNVFTLTVPTGGGKTLTSLAFALAHAREHGLDRVVVVIPFTSVIEQTAQVYRDALGALGHAVLEHHSGFDLDDEANWAADRVGPERLKLAMERWDSPIVVTTAVQFFESLFAARPSRCRKLCNLARSVIVVDEAQTMPLALLRPCVAALKELQRVYSCSVVLCTATQPALKAGPGESGFPGGFRKLVELAPPSQSLFRALRRVTVRDIGVQDDAVLAARMAASPQALCIVNQRRHAQALFGAIGGLDGARHLSTCMHSVHRRRVLDDIRRDLHESRPCRVVSTSLVEAGVDLDFPTVMRASAGLDQIAQAAGRCNREGKRAAADSEVLVFEAPAFGVIQQLRVQAETGQTMLRRYASGDPFGPEAMRDYFETLYHRKGKEELDRKGVLEMCEDHAGDLNFPFESIAAAMRFIDDTMVPVIIEKEEARPGEVGALVDRLRYGGIGGIARALNRYTVGVPRRVRSAMVVQGVAEVIRPAEFGDQFVVLLNLDLYTAEAGLDWSDLLSLGIDNLIV